MIVVGGGLGGVCAALKAAELGASVLLVEASKELGGTALHSGGAIHIWGAESWEEYLTYCPSADPRLARVVVDQFRPFVDWLSSWGAKGTYSATAIRGITIPKYQIGDSIMPCPKRAWFAHMGKCLEQLGGRILLGTRGVALALLDGVVSGIEVELDGKRVVLESKEVILASGGFQRARDLLRLHLGEGAASSVPRAVPEAVGDALMMSLNAGAALTASMDTIYGHLMPAPPCQIRWENYLDPMLLSAYYAGHGIVVNSSGERFADEGRGDLNGEMVNAASRQTGQLWVILDTLIRRRHAIYELPSGWIHPSNLRYASFLPHLRVRAEKWRLHVGIDGLSLSQARGAVVLTENSVDDLTTAMADHGVDDRQLAMTIADFNTALSNGEGSTLDVPRSGTAQPLLHPPFHAIKVAPGISMTYGGISIDAQARVLSREGAPIPGLRAIPGAAGGVHHLFYGGALASIGVYGMVAGAEVGTGLEM